MKRNLACARTRESAARGWLERYEPADGAGAVGPVSDTDLFGPDVVFEAFIAGADFADQEFAVERSTGQRLALRTAERHLRDGHAVLIEGGNVRPITTGPLSDPEVVEGLLAAAGQVDATNALSLAKATAFRLQTGDPRFDPRRPVCVNGFLYQPATEAL